MLKRFAGLVAAGLMASAVMAAPHTPNEAQELAARAKASAPTATGISPQATYVGAIDSNIETWQAIPFAVPPVGKNRLFKPSPISTGLGTVRATGTAKACPQQFFPTPNSTFHLPPPVQSIVNSIPIFHPASTTSEDCLTLNIQRPAGTKPGAKLPVLFFIYGGAFELGSTAMYSGVNLIQSSVAQDAPIIFVAANYRVSGWGFLPGADVKNAGVANLGLLDQRLALQWVADNIAAFGGDPSKVTIWGESAGSISVFDQMILYNGDNTYKGEPLFRGAIMDSGSVIPANPVDSFKGQAIYDSVVKYAGCSSASDTLQCLRNLPFKKFEAAVTSVPSFLSYNSVALSYVPRPDGTAITQSPEMLIESGQFAQVPFIIGDQEDEGTIFALAQLNLTTTADVVNYFKTLYFPDTPTPLIQELVANYPQNPAAGAPYGTGLLYNLYPQYKRLASILGDITFTLTRRAFLEGANLIYPSLPSYSYLNSYLDGLPQLGTFHGSDLLYAFGTVKGKPYTTSSTYYISFVNTLNPNTIKGSAKLPEWPLWSQGQKLVQLNAESNAIIPDTFRNASYTFLLDHRSDFRI